MHDIAVKKPLRLCRLQLSPVCVDESDKFMYELQHRIFMYGVEEIGRGRERERKSERERNVEMWNCAEL